MNVAILCTLMLTNFPCGVAPAARRQFEEAAAAASQANDQRDWLAVAARYQTLADSGLASAAVWNNLGNAYMRAGEKGPAVACYRQAERLRPRDRRISDNLALLIGKSSTEMDPSWWSWFRLGIGERRDLLAVGALTTFALGTFHLFWPTPARRRAALAALFLTALVAGGVVWDSWSIGRRGVVVAETVPRAGDAADFPARGDALAPGAEFSVLDRRGDWLEVRLDSGGTAWILSAAAQTY